MNAPHSNNRLPDPTSRLRLRHWTQADKAPFRLMNADARVMEYFPALLSGVESDALAERIDAHHSHHGFGLWAVELLETATFIGFCGVSMPSWEASFTPCVEIGWRLGHAYWGQGYASEAASSVLRFGFESLQLGEIVSFTAEDNLRSRRVMQRLGMSHTQADDFNHPLLPAGHRLAKHVLYRLSQCEWSGLDDPA